MKKKLLVFCLTVTVLICVLVVTVGAAEVIDGITYDLNNNGTARVTSANKTLDMEAVIIPEKVTSSEGKDYTVTELYGDAFRDNKNIKYVSLPSTLTKIGSAVFNGCSNLVFVDFNDNQNEISASGWGIMRGCNSLKAICFPDNMKTIGDQFLTGAQALTAVYLPANVEIIKGNKSAWDGPAFGNSPNMYLVNEKFEVRDENGNFYTAETFKMPERPEIYYFPSTLKAITGPHNTSGSFTMDENGMATNTPMEDCAFYNLPNINPVLVLPESYQGFDDRTVSGGNAQLTDHKGDTISSGLFQKCGTKEKPLTVVFLGEIDRVSMSRKDGNSSYTTYVFANKANTGFDNTKIGTWYDTSNTGYNSQDEMYVIFCHANGGNGAKYKVGFVGQEGNATYPVLTSELQENAAIHIHDVKKDALVSEPDCATDRLINTFCFCGKSLEVNKAQIGTALGHEYDLAKGALKSKIEYQNYLDEGILFIKCARCTECCENAVEPIIDDFKGFSVNYDGDGITFGYVFNKEAIKEFENVNNTTLSFGFVAGVKAFLGDKMPLDEGVTDVASATVDVNGEYTAFDFVLCGVWDKNVTVNEEEISLKDVEFYMAGYLTFGDTVVYLNASGSSSSADAVTFAQLDVPEAAE